MGAGTVRDPNVAEAIMRNARAAWRDQLRHQVTRDEPALGDSEVEARVDELMREVRSAGGRKGAMATRRTVLAARTVLQRQAEIAEMARGLLDAIESLGEALDEEPVAA